MARKLKATDKQAMKQAFQLEAAGKTDKLQGRDQIKADRRIREKNHQADGEGGDTGPSHPCLWVEWNT